MGGVRLDVIVVGSLERPACPALTSWSPTLCPCPAPHPPTPQGWSVTNSTCVEVVKALVTPEIWVRKPWRHRWHPTPPPPGPGSGRCLPCLCSSMGRPPKAAREDSWGQTLHPAVPTGDPDGAPAPGSDSSCSDTTDGSFEAAELGLPHSRRCRRDAGTRGRERPAVRPAERSPRGGPPPGRRLAPLT